MDHMEGIRPSARGCHIWCCRASLVLLLVSVPKFKWINLRHGGRNSISVFTVWLFVCLFVVVVVVVCIGGCGTLGVCTVV